MGVRCRWCHGAAQKLSFAPTHTRLPQHLAPGDAQDAPSRAHAARGVRLLPEARGLEAAADDGGGVVGIRSELAAGPA
jgi:hypothetical protein